VRARQLRPLRNCNILRMYGDMFTPFNAFGFTPDSSFDGTLFRSTPPLLPTKVCAVCSSLT